MDLQFWIWLIIIVITLIARASKKKPPQPAPPEDYEEREQPSSKPLTFEELLREIQAAKQQRRPEPEPVRPFRQPEPQPTVYKEIDYDDDLKEEEEDLETVPAAKDDSTAMDVYERAKREAFSR